MKQLLGLAAHSDCQQKLDKNVNVQKRKRHKKRAKKRRPLGVTPSQEQQKTLQPVEAGVADVKAPGNKEVNKGASFKRRQRRLRKKVADRATLQQSDQSQAQAREQRSDLAQLREWSIRMQTQSNKDAEAQKKPGKKQFMLPRVPKMAIQADPQPVCMNGKNRSVQGAHEVQTQGFGPGLRLLFKATGDATKTPLAHLDDFLIKPLLLRSSQ